MVAMQNGDVPHVDLAVRTSAPDSEAQPALPIERQYSHETAAAKERARQQALHHVRTLFLGLGLKLSGPLSVPHPCTSVCRLRHPCRIPHVDSDHVLTKTLASEIEDVSLRCLSLAAFLRRRRSSSTRTRSCRCSRRGRPFTRRCSTGSRSSSAPRSRWLACRASATRWADPAHGACIARPSPVPC